MRLVDSLGRIGKKVTQVVQKFVHHGGESNEYMSNTSDFKILTATENSHVNSSATERTGDQTEMI